MSDDRPPPMTTSDCNLQWCAFMPLHVAKLRDSDMAAEEEPEACWYFILLCSAAWHQVPAASLPNNDTVLMRLAGLGRDKATWKKHRAGALRGFILCNDDRYYHPFVAELALRAWEGRLATQTERSAAAERQARWREEQKRMSARLRELGLKPPEKASKTILAELLREHDPDWTEATLDDEHNGDRNVTQAAAVTSPVTQTVTPVTPKRGRERERESDRRIRACSPNPRRGRRPACGRTREMAG